MPLMYSSMPLDRCSNQRNNKRWLDREFSSASARFYLLQDDQHLFDLSDNFRPLLLRRSQLAKLSINSCIFLGKDLGRPFFALDANKLNSDCLASISALGEWQPLRQVTSNLAARDSAILALAKALVYWHKTHLYCGKCASLNQLVEAGHARRCTNIQCHNMTFPRTDPAVIMLVERICNDGVPRCLLGRQASWPAGVFSTLAGFVDPGESLEQAVRREVAEESGIQVTNVTYIDSQPWPFPASIMLGFTAQASSEEIDISKDSLQDAQWFSREQLRQFSARDSASARKGYRMSSADSISHHLIDAWKNQLIGQY